MSLPTTPNSAPPIYRHKIIESTNSEALRLGETDAPHHTVVIAEYQTGGRGQPGRSWWMPAGKGVLLSILLRSLPPGVVVDGLTLHVGWQLARLLEKFAGVKIDIKLPNDLLIGGKKVGGILCEARWREDQLRYVAIGVGINVNVLEFPDELKRSATSLALAIGHEIDLEDLTHILISGLRMM